MAIKFKCVKLGADPTNMLGLMQKSESTSQDITNTRGNILNNGYVTPPFDYYTLANVVAKNDLIYSCIDSYSQNICGFGYTISLKKEYADKKKIESLFKSQLEQLKAVFDNPNSKNESLISIMKREIIDHEMFGNNYIEIIRNVEGVITELYYIPTLFVRKREDEKGYVELDNTGQIVNYYKIFGDTKTISKKDGSEGEHPIENQANELIMFSCYNAISNATGGIYGCPRFISAEKAIDGNHYSSTSNNARFRNNHIPDKIIVVPNGIITSGEENLKDMFKNNFKTVEDYGKGVLVEVEGLEKEDGSLEKTEIQVVNLNDWTEANFLEFEVHNDIKIRRVYRLGKVMTGETDGINRATAQVSKEHAEEQVFSPERSEINDIFNQTIVRDVLKDESEIVVEFKFNPLQIKDQESNRKDAVSMYASKSASFNEIRNKLGLPPLSTSNADIPIFELQQTALKDAVEKNVKDNAKKVIDIVVDKMFSGSDNIAIKTMIAENFKDK